MTISAKIIKDSISEAGVRLTTLQLKYQRFFHSELMTHRAFSRNASSSRAIPVAKMIEQVRTNPAMPIHWGSNKPGMQAGAELTGKALEHAKKLWLMAAQYAANCAEEMQNKDTALHKQVANRILEPFQWIHVIVTATEWNNFFELRIHADAQPEIHELALQIKTAIDTSVPTLLKNGEWHLPYVTDTDHSAVQAMNLDSNVLRKISAARCARVSYLTHDGQEPDINKDLALYDRLITSKPAHASPIEHQATPNNSSEYAYLHGNFTGWVQFRKLVEHNLL
jgi:thymidylate synthase ThyX